MTTDLDREREVAQWQMLTFRARSFRWASAFLNPAQRRRVAALYAFCRAVDDIADADCVSPEGRAELQALKIALSAQPEREALWPRQYLWFRSLCLECGIDFRVVRELLVGMMSDLDLVRIQSDRELVRYCYRAAGTVGLMMCSVLGVRDPRALRHAIDLGIAMQMTNISRDVLEDAQACRVYLPAERLRELGLTPEDLVEGRADPEAVSVVVGDVLDLAERYYQSGDAGMRFLPARARWAILIASRLYRGIGRRLRRRYESNPLLGRVVVPWAVKLGLVASATVSWFRVTLLPRKSSAPVRYRDYLLGLPEGPATQKTSAATDAGTATPTVVHPRSHALGHPH